MEDTMIQVIAWIVVIAILAGIFFFVRGIWRAFTAVIEWLWDLITGNTERIDTRKQYKVDPDEKELRYMNNYLELDPEFDEEIIKTLSADFYVNKYLQGEDVNNVRPYLDIELKGWKQSAGRDYITVDLTSRFKSSGKAVKYKIDLSRKTGALTTKEISDSVCPHCGAPLQLDKAGKCEYCGSVIRVANSEWIINNIRLAQ